jgi:hypothetical protein
MKYKSVPISRAIEILVPLGLTPEQEAAYVADYIAKHDPEGELRKIIAEMGEPLSEAEYEEIKDLLEHPEKRVSFEAVMRELELDQLDEPPLNGEVA